MPLNKLENFIKNTDGRTLYVNPNDLNATDSINNQGTSLTEPFRTIQRALIESARFSYVRGNENDLVERTTILVYPGEHPIDNRPGYGIRVTNNTAVAVKPSGEEVDPFAAFNLTADSNFDIESPNNVLHRFNSIYGGVVVPRGTSIVGMDLRKTKIRPMYVPNPTDPAVPESAIFRITGTCYFWQFTIFDGRGDAFVYTDNKDFTEANRSSPTFSHNKLTAFEYADGVNPAVANGFELTDLAIYYSKLSNAYNEASGRPIDEKYPQDPDGFAPMRPEFEIVGAFATDPVRIARIISGDGFTPDTIITVDTVTPHNLNVETPIKVRGVAVDDYNISMKVAAILGPTRFQYLLPFVRPNLPAEPSVSSASVTVETDTVTGASPYIFNVSMRSVWGINGMHADGAKATGFRSMVVAQFTAISLQKDDRSFVKYNQPARRYDGINYRTVRGAELSALSSSTNTATVYHLDPRAIYRPEWETTHIKMSNDAVIQIVSVFAIGFNQHFAAINGADASITNSNSNFGQFALLSIGFKNDAFDKDDQGFISSVITPNNAFNPETDSIEEIDWVNLDFQATYDIGFDDQLYLLGYTNAEDKPPAISQGFRLGANYNDRLFQPTSESVAQGATEPFAQIKMINNVIGEANNRANGTFIGRKVYPVIAGPSNNTLTLADDDGEAHGLLNGEKIRIFSASGDLPENVETATLYYANVVDEANIRLATSESNAANNIFLNIYGGSDLRIESRVNDKESGDLGHPIQYDQFNRQWFIFTNFNSGIHQYIKNNVEAGVVTSEDGKDFVSSFKRFSDNRSLDDKLYRLRYVIPKESTNAKPPTPGYILQASSDTGARGNDDFVLTQINIGDYRYDRNTRFVASAAVTTQNNPPGVNAEIEVRTEKPHSLSVGDKIKMLNITSTDNPTAEIVRGYNGQFIVTQIISSRVFRYNIQDINGFTRNPGIFTNNVNDRNILLPRFERKDNQVNSFVYRIETIVDFEEGVRDGIYHLFCCNGGNKVEETFSNRKYNQPIEDFYPQFDPDNLRNNPEASRSFANRAPLGKVTIDEPQNSITRETIDAMWRAGNRGTIKSVTDTQPDAQGRFTSIIEFERAHEFNAVYSYTNLVSGSGYNVPDGSYYNVRLLSDGGSIWKGASAKVTIVNKIVTGLEITDYGSAYTPGETLLLDSSTIGAGNGASITIDVSSIENNVDTVIQLTGGGQPNPDIYTFITAVNNDTTISVARTENTGEIAPGMYALPTDSATVIDTYSYNAADGVSTFISANSAGFGLQRGQSIVVFATDGTLLGKFYVKNLSDPDNLEVVTNRDLSSGGFTIHSVGKCGFEDNDASTGATGENVGVRGVETFDLGTFFLEESSGKNNVIRVRAKDGGTAGIPEKMWLGRYLKVGNEIMRVANEEVAGNPQNIVNVIRGALGTNVTNHKENSKVKAIEPTPIELRRPSILRASGHTFEYLGYGPGNYSTSLPQLQVRQLPEEETYLVQAQELSCGQVVYTGMSDNGDFYIGNIKYSATSGTQITFDVPVPTVAGQLASSNSVVFDEVIINRRLFVAGGETNEVLSQFDGPVKFTQPVTIQSKLNVSESITTPKIFITSTDNSTSPGSGAIVIRGGAGIERDLHVGGNIYIHDDILDPDVHGRMYNNYYDVFPGTGDTEAVVLFPSTPNFDLPILVGNETGKVRFLTEVPGTGEGGEDDIDNSDGGVEIMGSLVVRDAVIAKEFRGDGLGKPGSIIMWGGTAIEDNEQTPYSIPKGYLLCNGRTLNKNQYPKLFRAIGYTHGGSGNSFKLPDLRERFIVGSGGDNGTVADSAGYNVTETGGSNLVTLTVAEMPRHNHPVSNVDQTHNHPASSTTLQQSAPHVHPATIGQQGNHVHPGTVDTGGQHRHTGTTVAKGGHTHSVRQSRGNTAASGGHSHISGMGGAGGHNHGAASGGGGQHNHQSNTGGAGGHNHAASSGQNGGHNHPFNIISNGGHNHSAGSSGNGSHAHTTRQRNNDTGSAGTHNHNLSLNNVGNHGHGVTYNEGGSHAHLTNTVSEGSHTHPGNTVARGSHGHPGTASGGGHLHQVSMGQGGDHRHGFERSQFENQNTDGGNNRPFNSDSVDKNTQPAGLHSHPFSLSTSNHNHELNIKQNGLHDHNVQLNARGSHSHTVQMQPAGQHNHQVGVQAAGSHGHTLASMSTAGTSHRHSVSIDSNSNHSHTINVNPVGSHNHTTSIGAVGQHVHPVSTSPVVNHIHNVAVQPVGNHTHPINTSPVQDHVHPVTTDPVSNHNHDVAIDPIGNHTHPYTTSLHPGHAHTFTTQTKGEHNHPVTVFEATNQQAIHNHQTNTTIGQRTLQHIHELGNIGGQGQHENRPPYYALCYIIQYK